MAIRNVGDIVAAFSAGRVHTQRFIKTGASQTGDGQWQDWAYTAGQPAFNARVGSPLVFQPEVATRNDAIWFPGKEATQERRLLGLRLYQTASGNDQVQVEYQMYDLLGYYPLIDGDSTDLQEMDNSLPLPRYTDGEGVMAVLVNHVSVALSVANPTITYVDNAGATKSTQIRSTTYGLGKAAWVTNTSGSAGPLYVSLAAGSRGVRSITSMQFDVAAGGLWCIYLVKPILAAGVRGGLAGVNQTVMTQMCLACDNAFDLPIIEDGASLGFFYMPNGGARQISTVFGAATFIWG